jgi:hypothetical protein
MVAMVCIGSLLVWWELFLVSSLMVPSLDLELEMTQVSHAPLEMDRQMNTTSNLHFVISTGCSPFQHWQSYASFYSILKTNPKASGTRIASRCTETDAVLLKQRHKEQIQSRMSPYGTFTCT